MTLKTKYKVTHFIFNTRHDIINFNNLYYFHGNVSIFTWVWAGTDGQSYPNSEILYNYVGKFSNEKLHKNGDFFSAAD